MATTDAAADSGSNGATNTGIEGVRDVRGERRVGLPMASVAFGEAGDLGAGACCFVFLRARPIWLSDLGSLTRFVRYF